MHESLTTSRSVSSKVVEEFMARLDNLEKILHQLVMSKTEEAQGQISLNIESISKSLVPVELRQGQVILEDSISAIMYDTIGRERGFLIQSVDHIKTSVWLDSLGNLLGNYKWATKIPFSEVLRGLTRLKYYPRHDQEIPAEQIMRLYGLYRNIPDEERESFSRSVLLKLQPLIRPEPEKTDDDIPF